MYLLIINLKLVAKLSHKFVFSFSNQLEAINTKLELFNTTNYHWINNLFIKYLLSILITFYHHFRSDSQKHYYQVEIVSIENKTKRYAIIFINKSTEKHTGIR